MLLVTPVAAVFPFIVTYMLEESFWRLCLTVVVSLVSSSAVIFFVGLTEKERKTVTRKGSEFIRKLIRY